MKLLPGSCKHKVLLFFITLASLTVILGAGVVVSWLMLTRFGFQWYVLLFNVLATLVIFIAYMMYILPYLHKFQDWLFTKE